MSQQLLFNDLVPIVAETTTATSATTTTVTTVLTMSARGTLTNPQVITSTNMLTAQ